MKRDRWTIIGTLLTTASQPSGKTKLMYEGNLSYSQTLKYLSELLDLGLIQVVSINPHSKFQITDPGKEWLRRFNQLDMFHNSLRRCNHE